MGAQCQRLPVLPVWSSSALVGWRVAADGSNWSHRARPGRRGGLAGAPIAEIGARLRPAHGTVYLLLQRFEERRIASEPGRASSTLSMQWARSARTIFEENRHSVGAGALASGGQATPEGRHDKDAVIPLFRKIPHQ